MTEKMRIELTLLLLGGKVEALKKLNAQCDGGDRDGGAGSDVALETADEAWMFDNLNHLPFAVGLSRQTSRIIRETETLRQFNGLAVNDPRECFHAVLRHAAKASLSSRTSLANFSSSRAPHE